MNLKPVHTLSVFNSPDTMAPILNPLSTKVNSKVRSWRGKILDSINVAELQKILQDRASQLWLENQKFMSSEVGFATLT